MVNNNHQHRFNDDLVFHVDRDLRVTWSSRINTRSGTKDLTGKKCHEIYFGIPNPCPGCPIQTVFIAGNILHSEVSSPDGRKKFEIACYPVNGDKRNVETTVVVSRDITGFKAIIDLSREIENLKRALFRESQKPIVLIDPVTLLLYEFNDAALKFLGYSREEFAEVHLYDLEMNKTSKQVKAYIEDVVRKGQDQNETVFCTQRGELKDCELDLRRIILDGQELIYTVIHDITARKKADLALQKSEARYRSLIENSPDVIMEVDPNGDILYTNRILKGTRKEDAVGTSFLDYVPVTHHKKVRNSLSRSLIRGRNTAYEISVVTPNGTRWWSTRALPIEKDGRIDRFLMIVTDITASKRSEEALKLSEERYRNLVDNSPLPILVHRDERVIYINKMAVKLFGASNTEELYNKRILDVIHSDDKPQMERLLSQAYSPSRERLHSEFKVVTKDGSVRDVEVTSILVNFEGDTARLAILNDVTQRNKDREELMKSEQKYRYLTENMRDAVWMMDLNWNHIYISPSIEDIRGFTPQEIHELPIEKSLPPRSLENAMRLLSQALMTRGKDEQGRPLMYKFEQEEYCKDGSTVWTEVQASLVFNENDDVVAMMGITRDISEQRKIREALAKEKEVLRQSEERYRGFVDNLPIPILIHRGNRIIYMNRQALELHEAGDFGEIENLGMQDFIHDECRERISKKMLKMEKNPGEMQVSRYKLKTIRGNVIDITSQTVTVDFEGDKSRLVIFRKLASPVEA